MRSLFLLAFMASMCVRAFAQGPVFPTVQNVGLNGSFDRVMQSFNKESTNVMTGYDKVTASYTGTVFNMHDVPFAISSDGEGRIYGFRADLYAGDQWNQVLFVRDAVVAAMVRDYGKPVESVEDFGGGREYSPSTKMIRLQRKLVDIHDVWHVGPWTVTVSVGYNMRYYGGEVVVVMASDRKEEYAASRKALRKGSRDSARRQKKEKRDRRSTRDRRPGGDGGGKVVTRKDGPDGFGSSEAGGGTSPVVRRAVTDTVGRSEAYKKVVGYRYGKKEERR